jgi:predicted dienelactone hydrolase
LGHGSGLTARAAAAREESRRLHLAGLSVAAWLPPEGHPAPWPVVVFSHGFHGCAEQSSFLAEALAKAGYAVFAPEHRDAACGNLRAFLSPPDTSFGDPRRWTDKTYADRAADVRGLLDALAADPRFGSAPFDAQHVGLVGHSLGGYTALGVAGGWPGWTDARVKAVLALSPYAVPFTAKKTLGGLGVPVMFQGGTRDIGITPWLKGPNGAFAEAPKPKYYVELDGAGHLAWTDLRQTYQAVIIDYSRGFLDRALKGKTFPPTLAAPRKGIAAVRIEE